MNFIKISLLALIVTLPTIEHAQAHELGETADRVVAGAADCVVLTGITGTAGALVGYGVKLVTKSEAAGVSVFVASAAAGCAAGAYIGSTAQESYPSSSDLTIKDDAANALGGE